MSISYILCWNTKVTQSESACSCRTTHKSNSSYAIQHKHIYQFCFAQKSPNRFNLCSMMTITDQQLGQNLFWSSGEYLRDLTISQILSHHQLQGVRCLCIGTTRMLIFCPKKLFTGSGKFCVADGKRAIFWRVLRRWKSIFCLTLFPGRKILITMWC